MQVICLEEIAFYQLVEQVVERIKEKYSIKEDRWVSTAEAMNMLKITSKSTLQKFRNEGKIKFSQPEKRIILYDKESIYLFLEKHAKNTF